MLKKHRIPLGLSIIALILASLAFRRGGWTLAIRGLHRGISLLIQELPLLTAAFLTAGFLQALVSKEMVTKWLGEGSGWKGILLACLGGGLMPGGPYAYYPISSALLKSGASLGVLIGFVTAKNLWSLSRLPLEIAILGVKITLSRFLITLVIPPLMAVLAEKLFGDQIDIIRDQVKV